MKLFKAMFVIGVLYAAQSEQPVVQEDIVLKRLSSSIRLSNLSDERRSLKASLHDLLQSTQGSLSDALSFAFRVIDDPNFVQSLSSSFFYVQGPSVHFVVMEKLSLESIQLWKDHLGEILPRDMASYIEMEDLLRYEREYVEDGKLEEWNEKYAWRKYLLSDEGLSYFKKRIRSFKEDTPYDMFVAYVTTTNPAVLFQQRLASRLVLQDIDMVMTIQAKVDLNLYSPMGISRTIVGAKKMLVRELSGMPVEQLSLNLSVWFHLLCARMVRDLYPSVQNFFTVPTQSMRILLAKALHPELVFVQEGAEVRILQNVQKVRAVARDVQIPWLVEEEFLTCSGAVPDFNDLGAVETLISVDDLLHLSFPYF